MSLYNKVQLIGHLGKDPEVKTLDNNQKIVKFSLATNENYKDKQGEWQSETTWHNIVAWQKTADRIEKFLKKGSYVLVEGKISNRSYEKEGQTRYISEIVVNNYIHLDRSENILSNDNEEVTENKNDGLPF